MKQRWSLEALYSSFDSEEFKNDFSSCDSIIRKVNKIADSCLSGGDPVYNAEQCIKGLNEYSATLSKLWAFTSLTLSVESKNTQAVNFLEKLEAKTVELTEARVKMQKWFASIENIETLKASSELISEHSFFLKEQISEAKYLLSEKEELAIATLKKTGSSSWRNLCNMLTSNLLVPIEIDGEQKELPLPVIRSMSHDKERDTRKKAYQAELAAYSKIEVPMAACLNAIKGEVQSVSKMRGYSSPLEMTLINSRMQKETLSAMLSAIEKSLPSFRKYYKKKNELLGNKDGMPFFDLFAPVGSVDMKFSYDEAKEFIVKNFGTFSTDLADFAENAFNNNWIDSEPREGKRGGAFCYNIHTIKESRILANFKNSLSDVFTLAHELGHAYHAECLKDESHLNSDYSMPVAETASIFCETIVNNAAMKDASQEELTAILEGSLAGAGQVIVDIYSRYLFESRLFELRSSGSVSVEQLNNLMLEAQKDAYGDALDDSYLHPSMWINKPHYYYVEANFYNFPYAFGLLFAKGLYGEYLKQGKNFVPKYDELLRATGKNSVEDIASIMGINITTEDFWKSSLKLIEKDIEQFLEL